MRNHKCIRGLPAVSGREASTAAHHRILCRQENWTVASLSHRGASVSRIAASPRPIDWSVPAPFAAVVAVPLTRVAVSDNYPSYCDSDSSTGTTLYDYDRDSHADD